MSDDGKRDDSELVVLIQRNVFRELGNSLASYGRLAVGKVNLRWAMVDQNFLVVLFVFSLTGNVITSATCLYRRLRRLPDLSQPRWLSVEERKGMVPGNNAMTWLILLNAYRGHARAADQKIADLEQEIERAKSGRSG